MPRADAQEACSKDQFARRPAAARLLGVDYFALPRRPCGQEFDSVDHDGLRQMERKGIAGLADLAAEIGVKHEDDWRKRRNTAVAGSNWGGGD